MKVNNRFKSIAIGSFDGIHIAHQELISRVDAVVVIERNGGHLTTGYKRSSYIKKPCFFYHFDKIKSLTPQEFISRLLEDFPSLEEIVVGYDFFFGKNKAGDTQTIEQFFPGKVTVINEVTIDGIAIHSRTIRLYLHQGNIAMANRLLGRRYSIEGDIITGQGVGKRELVPTLNLKSEHYILPAEGVYATRTKVGESWYDSVSFFGHRVTTDGSYAVETHIIDRDIGEVMGSLEIEFVAFVRKNRRFDSLEALKSQIGEDIVEAKRILQQCLAISN